MGEISDILKSLPKEKLDKIEPISIEEFNEVLKKGIEIRNRIEKYEPSLIVDNSVHYRI